MEIGGRVVLITGASEGIGAACARAFARRGARLSLIARSRSKLESVAAACAAESLVTAGDLCEDETRQRVVRATRERFGRIDVLVNNAGVGLYVPSWKAPLDQVRALFELNFYAALGLAQLTVPGMIQQGSGCIVNVGSIAGKMTLPWLTLYSASKYALGSWTEGLRMELKGTGVHAVLVCPGYVHTDFQSHVLGGRPPDALVRGRVFAVSAEECAAAIVRGVARNARTVLSPRVGWLAVAAARSAPGWMERRLVRLNRDAQERG